MATLVRIRRVPETDQRIKLELLEIKAVGVFDKETTEAMYPGITSKVTLAYKQYTSLLTVRHLNRRLLIACLLQLIQQFTGKSAAKPARHHRIADSHRYQRHHLLRAANLPKDRPRRQLRRPPSNWRRRHHQLPLHNPRHHVHGPLGPQEGPTCRRHGYGNLAAHRRDHLRRVQGLLGDEPRCRVGDGGVHLDLHLQLCVQHWVC